MARSLKAEWRMKDSCSGEKCLRELVAFVGLNNNTILAMQNIELDQFRQTDPPIQQKSKRYRS